MASTGPFEARTVVKIRSADSHGHKMRARKKFELDEEGRIQRIPRAEGEGAYTERKRRPNKPSGAARHKRKVFFQQQCAVPGLLPEQPKHLYRDARSTARWSRLENEARQHEEEARQHESEQAAVAVADKKNPLPQPHGRGED